MLLSKRRFLRVWLSHVPNVPRYLQFLHGKLGPILFGALHQNVQRIAVILPLGAQRLLPDGLLYALLQGVSCADALQGNRRALTSGWKFATVLLKRSAHTFLYPLNGRSMGRLNRLSTKSWKVEKRCFISSSETLNPSSTLTAIVNDRRWLSLWSQQLSQNPGWPFIYTPLPPPPVYL